MIYDIFAFWSSGQFQDAGIQSYYVKTKYYLTRDPSDTRKKYLAEISTTKYEDMSAYMPSVSCINGVPQFSFFLQFSFTLATPWLSRDDEAFYIIDNPVRKEKVFKVPMVSGSTWKGNLRWTARQQLNLYPDKPDSPEIIRLFGNERDKEDNFRRGRLNFYPTFFNNIGLEVINPHDRKTKAGTMPIYIECVPEGAKGIFSLLYVPFDLMGRPQTQIKQEVCEDLDIICSSLKEMMLTYGFSAKKSSGFGIVDNQIEGAFEMSGITLYKDSVSPPEKQVISGPFAKLAELKIGNKQDKPKDNTFSSFDDLERIINRVIKERLKND